MITNYISGAHAILLCYDITNFESFANLEDWYGLVTRTFPDGKRPYLAIVGNKSKYFLTVLDSQSNLHTSLMILTSHYFVALDDLRHLMAVKLELHTKFAEENEMSSFLLSAKSGDQIKQAFYKIASLLAGEILILLYQENLLVCYFLVHVKYL
jgi:Ras-related protein Rab-28